MDWTQEFFPFKDDPHSNGWDLYFEFIKCNEPLLNEATIKESRQAGSHELHDQICCLDSWVNYQDHLSYRLAVCNKVKDYIKIKDVIKEEANAFHEQYLKGAYCIGVHVRFAAAHNCEMPNGRISVEEYIRTVKELMNQHMNSSGGEIKIFLATDSNYVIDQLSQCFSSTQLYFINAVRGSYDEDPHLIYVNAGYWMSHPAEFHARKPGYFGGKAVLLDCLLLSKCNVFVHSVSNVSSFVSFFNPYIDSVFLPRGLSPPPFKLKLDAF